MFLSTLHVADWFCLVTCCCGRHKQLQICLTCISSSSSTVVVPASLYRRSVVVVNCHSPVLALFMETE